MAKHAAPARSAWRPLALALAGCLALAGTGTGVLALLQAVASGSQTTATGTLSLTLARNGTFGTAVTGAAPGDLVHRFVTVTNAGTLDASGLTLAVTGTGAPELLTADATALRLTVTACSVAWNPAGTTGGVAEGSCSGSTSSTTVSGASVATLTASRALLTGTFAGGHAHHLRLSLRVPDNNEVTANGIPPAGSVQGRSADLTFTFSEQQRTASVTSS